MRKHRPITFADLATIGVEIVVLDSPNKAIEVHRAVAKILDEEYRKDREEDRDGRFR